MADTKVSALANNTDPQPADELYIVDDPAGTPASEAIALSVLRDAFESGGALELVTISATNLTTGTIPAARIGADTIDAITEIAAALKSGADLTLITGTAGTSGDLAQWNVDGDLVDGPTPPAGAIVGTSDAQTLTNKSIAASQIDSGTLPAARLGADSIDTITEIAAALKTGSDGTLCTGTAGSSGQLAEWNADGDLVAPTAKFRDLWIPASAMTPRTTNGAESSTEEYATNDIMVDHYLFDASTEEAVQFLMRMPDDYDLGTIKFKAYWDAVATASGTAVWGLSAGALSDSSAIDAALGTEVTVTDTLLTVGDLHVSPASSAVTIGGTPALDDMVVFQVALKTSGTIAVDCKLIGIAIQYGTLTSVVAQW